MGKPLAYEQIDAWELKKLSGKTGRTPPSDTLWQHFEEIAKDHQNGVFAGTNDLVQKIGGKRPMGLPEVCAGKQNRDPRVEDANGTIVLVHGAWPRLKSGVPCKHALKG